VEQHTQHKSKTNKEILREILKISIPQMVSFVCVWGKLLVNLTMLGHVGTESEIAAAGIATITGNIMGLSITIGLACALGTLISQAIGKKDYELCGVYINRCGILILCIFSVCFVIL